MATNHSDRVFTVELTLEEGNTVIEALGQLPFMRVYKIIEKIHVTASSSSHAAKEAAGPKKTRKK